eukprot:tig00000093_g3438.t1
MGNAACAGAGGRAAASAGSDRSRSRTPSFGMPDPATPTSASSSGEEGKRRGSPSPWPPAAPAPASSSSDAHPSHDLSSILFRRAVQSHGVLAVLRLEAALAGGAGAACPPPEAWRLAQVSANAPALLGLGPRPARSLLGLPLTALLAPSSAALVARALRPALPLASSSSFPSASSAAGLPLTSIGEDLPLEGAGGAGAAGAAPCTPSPGAPSSSSSRAPRRRTRPRPSPAAAPPPPAPPPSARPPPCPAPAPRLTVGPGAWRAGAVEEGSDGEACGGACEGVLAAAGLDRAVAYALREDGSGEVLAERRAPGAPLPSILGARFPADDLPRACAALFRDKAVRVICDAAAEASPLVPATLDGDPSPGEGEKEEGRAPGPARRELNLSKAHLRAVVPCHAAYMLNSGTRASLSVAVYCGAALWGFILCHAAEPRLVPAPARAAAASIAAALAAALARLRERRAAALEAAVFLRAGRELPAAELLFGSTPSALDLLPAAAGAALVPADPARPLLRLGRCPPDADARALGRWLSERLGGGDFYFTEALPAEFGPFAPHAAFATGLLACAASPAPAPRDWLLWFRAPARAALAAPPPPSPRASPPPAARLLGAQLWSATDLSAARALFGFLRDLHARAD